MVLIFKHFNKLLRTTYKISTETATFKNLRFRSTERFKTRMTRQYGRQCFSKNRNQTQNRLCFSKINRHQTLFRDLAIRVSLLNGSRFIAPATLALVAFCTFAKLMRGAASNAEFSQHSVGFVTLDSIIGLPF